MTSLEFWIYVTGAIAVLSCIPWLRVLRASMELSRARIFLRWRSYTKVLRLGGLAIVSFLIFIAASVVLEPEERTLRTFMPVGMFILLLQIGAVYLGWTNHDIARGPRKKTGSPVFLLLGPGLGIKAALLATGIPAILILLRVVLFIPYRSETVKARFFLHFARTHRAHRFMVLLAVVGIIANTAYTVWNPAYLQERVALLPTGFGVLFFNLGFIAFAAFITWTMSGGSPFSKK